MLAWMPLVIYLFWWLPAPKAVVISFIAAWLFLPQGAGFVFTGIPDYTRMSATCYGIFLATLIFDAQRLRSFKFSWLDWPMLIWCLCPIPSSLSNGLGAYHGFSLALSQTVAYGLPYFLGRIYLNNLAGLRYLAMSMLVGGLIYVPLCLYEIRMSPQVHYLVYGYHNMRAFLQSMRLGGYRPYVFMQHGLSVGMWMMAATLIGIWLWQAGCLKRRLWGISIEWFLLGLLFTFVLVRSAGAYLYFAYGIATLLIVKWFRTAIPLFFLVGAILFYLFLGISGNFSETHADRLVTIASQLVGSERAGSLEFRIENEEMLARKAREQLVFGWGGFGRARIYEENWEGDLVDVSITDSLWIIAFGDYGVVGVAAIFSSSLLPTFVFFGFRYRASLWFNPNVAPAAVLALVIVLYMVDCTLNNLPNPVFTMTSGGIAGLVLTGGAKNVSQRTVANSHDSARRLRVRANSLRRKSTADR